MLKKPFHKVMNQLITIPKIYSHSIVAGGFELIS